MIHRYWEFVVLFLIWLAFLVISWGKLPQYFVAWNMDLGKEIMVPLRILNGEVPIKDFGLLYPPFPYYLNAGFLYLFGKTFTNFFILGAVQSVCYLVLAWQFLSKIMVENWFRWLLLLVLITCAIFPGENDGRFIFPYTFNWSYSLLFAFSALIFLAQYLENKNRLMLLGAGFYVGLTLLSKQDFLFCAILSLFVGLMIEYFLMPEGDKKKIWFSASFVFIGFCIPVLVFNAYLFSQGVSLRAILENLFPPQSRLNLLNQLPVWYWYTPFTRRFIVFGLLLLMSLLSVWAFDNKKLHKVKWLLLGGVILLVFRQILKDSIQIDFRGWVVILSMGFGVFHLTQLKTIKTSKNYLLSIFAISALAYQMRFILQHGVININWSGNLNIFILFGALLGLVEIGKNLKGNGPKIYKGLMTFILFSIIFSSSLHIYHYYKENRWQKVMTKMGGEYAKDS